jgi:hypothetical protein
MDAQALTFPDNKFTHSFTNFAIMATAEPDKATAHILLNFEVWRYGCHHNVEHRVVFHTVQKAAKPDAPVSRSLTFQFLESG